MAKVTMNRDYALKVLEFCNLIQRDQTEKHGDVRTVYSETGRKFDKIYIDANGNTTVRYFVRREDGSIFGAKSAAAPNLSWYFGTLDTVKKWNWSDFHGVPVSDDSVRLVKRYGGYSHYMPIK